MYYKHEKNNVFIYSIQNYVKCMYHLYKPENNTYVQLNQMMIKQLTAVTYNVTISGMGWEGYFLTFFGVCKFYTLTELYLMYSFLVKKKY